MKNVKGFFGDESYLYRDNYGSRIGSVDTTKNFFGEYIVRNKHGNKIGTVSDPRDAYLPNFLGTGSKPVEQDKDDTSDLDLVVPKREEPIIVDGSEPYDMGPGAKAEFPRGLLRLISLPVRTCHNHLSVVTCCQQLTKVAMSQT